MGNKISDDLLSRAKLFEVLSQEKGFLSQIERAATLLKEVLIKNSGKVLIFGNGGSAAQAQHFAAELICRFEKDRRALPAIALTTDSSILTAQSNDSGFDLVFSRQIEALGRRGDLAIGLTTSDIQPGGSHSLNIYNGFIAVGNMGMASIGLFSQKTQKILELVDVAITVPHHNTAVIQEVHQFIIHELCSLVEKEF